MKYLRSLRLCGAAGALVLAGCASQQEQLVPQVQQGERAGVKTISVAAAPLVCDGPRCPALAAVWAADKPGQAVLTIGLPYQSAEVTGADFHLGPAGVVRVRSRSSANAGVLGYPATAFDVPLRLATQIAYTPRSWLRVYTADGKHVDETIDSGEARARAAEAFAYFITAVEQAGGQGSSTDAPRGGLFERLGIEEKK